MVPTRAIEWEAGGLLRGRLAATGLAVVAALLAGPVRARADFYTPPSPLPKGRPGDVIRAEPMRALLLPGVPLPARAWRILYRSTSATGHPIAVSGTVLVPTAGFRGGTRPLVGYGIGTQGMADRCAPSKQLAAGSEYEAAGVLAALARGWAVALTDYPGLGPPGDHPYAVGRALGRAVLDSMRAARRLREASLGGRRQFGLLGYSEGGAAAGWAAQLQPTYARDLPLVGAGVGAAPADLPFMLRHHDGGRFFFLVMWGAVGLDAAYPDLHLDRYLNARGRRLRDDLTGKCLIDGIFDRDAQYTRLAHVTTAHPAERSDWRARLEENLLGDLAPAAPVFITWARSDPIVPYAQAEPLRRRWCSRGVNVRLRDVISPGLGGTPLTGLEHVTGGVLAIPTMVDWLAGRFAGRPLPQPRECRVTRRGKPLRRAVRTRPR